MVDQLVSTTLSDLVCGYLETHIPQGYFVNSSSLVSIAQGILDAASSSILQLLFLCPHPKCYFPSTLSQTFSSHTVFALLE